jgi:hypothetical protein
MLLVLLLGQPIRGETRDDAAPVDVQETEAAALRLRIRGLAREQRLRIRAARLVRELGLFDELATRSRQVVATEKQTDAEGMFARHDTELSVAHETSGIGDLRGGAMGLAAELEELQAELQRLRGIVK